MIGDASIMRFGKYCSYVLFPILVHFFAFLPRLPLLPIRLPLPPKLRLLCPLRLLLLQLLTELAVCSDLVAVADEDEGYHAEG